MSGQRLIGIVGALAAVVAGCSTSASAPALSQAAFSPADAGPPVAYCDWLIRLNSASVSLLNAAANRQHGSPIVPGDVQASYRAANLALGALPAASGTEETRLVFKWVAVAYDDLDVAAALDPSIRPAAAPPLQDAAQHLMADLNAALQEQGSPRFSPAPAPCASQ